MCSATSGRTPPMLPMLALQARRLPNMLPELGNHPRPPLIYLR